VDERSADYRPPPLGRERHAGGASRPITSNAPSAGAKSARATDHPQNE
jgi:hypothetical protein